MWNYLVQFKKCKVPEPIGNMEKDGKLLRKIAKEMLGLNSNSCLKKSAKDHDHFRYYDTKL